MYIALYLSSLMFGWGIVSMSMGFVKTYHQLVALRFLLGVFEAGVMPGIIYLTSMYYKRHEFQIRMSSFLCSVVVAGAIGGVSGRETPPDLPIPLSYTDVYLLLVGELDS